MYFKLNSSSYLVTGQDGGTIYDLVFGKMIHINKEYIKELTELDNGKNLESSKLPQEFIEKLIADGVANTFESNVYIDKVRIGLPRNIKKFSFNPQRVFNLYLQLQDQCNLNCSHCTDSGSVHRTTGCRRYEQNASTDNIGFFINGMADAFKLGCKTVHILGGEPLLNEDVLTKVIDEAICIGYSNIYIYSNIYLLSEENVQNYTKKVKFIIHIGEEIQKYFKNKAECYNIELEDKINLLREYKIPYYFNICITPKISKYKDSILKYIESLKPKGYVYNYVYTNLEDDEYYYQLCNSFVEQNQYVNEYSFFNNIDHHPCLYGKFTIFADGSIGVCPMMPEKTIGSIIDMDLSTILVENKQDPYWNLSLDKIDGCNDCSKRYACNDCRAVKESIEEEKRNMLCLLT